MAYLCLTDFNNLPKIKVGGIDKTVHFVLHFFFTLFWDLYFSRTKAVQKYSTVVAVFLSLAYGSLIELGQEFFTTSRNADIRDILANSVGTISACIIMFFLGHTKTAKF